MIISIFSNFHVGIQYVGGNMFESVPQGDVIILKVCKKYKSRPINTLFNSYFLIG